MSAESMSSGKPSHELILRLFASGERYGWQYVEPTPARPSPLAGEEPKWAEPPENLRQWSNHPIRMRWIVAGTLLMVFGLRITTGGSASFFVIVGGLLLAYQLLPHLIPPLKNALAEFNRNRDRQRRWQHYRFTHDRWSALVQAHDEQERLRRAMAPVWYPVQARQHPTRVDVFGGGSAGWANLLATAGASWLADGLRVIVFDLSEQAVSGGLAVLATERGISVDKVGPLEAHAMGLIDDLTPEDLSELLAETIHSISHADGPDLRTLHARILRSAAVSLTNPITIPRMTAALHFLQGTYEKTETLLSDAEQDLLTKRSLQLDQGRIQNELANLIDYLDPIAAPLEATGPKSWWSAQAQLRIIGTDIRPKRRKELFDRILIHRLIHDLASNTMPAEPVLLVIAGADHLGRETLEELDRAGRHCRYRLVYLIEHLRGDVVQLLGAGAGTTIIMKLGNAQEADAAATFIGKGHKFILNERTSQTGETFMEGESSSIGLYQDISMTDGAVKRGGQFWSDTVSHGDIRQHTYESSRSWSFMAGKTQSRVYEFTIEPTSIQALPSTSFIYVEAGALGRRIILADCNPGIALMDRVALHDVNESLLQ